MKTNSVSYYVSKYLPLVLGIGLIAYAVRACFFADTFDADTDVPDNAGALIAGMIGLILLLLPFLYWSTMVRVEFADGKILIHQGSETITKNWEDVTVLNKVYNMRPALYKIRFQRDEDHYLFFTEEVYQSTHDDDSRRWDPFNKNNELAHDPSEMGRLIARKKREHNIF